MDSPSYNSLPDFNSSPWVINFNKTKTEETTKETQIFINPFSGCVFEASLPIVEGKQCLECFGDWLLILDEGTRECFLANITSHSKISLSPLLVPVKQLGRCALSSPSPPDCTVMFACSWDARFVLYCRPGDKEWIKCDIDFENSYEYFTGTIFGSKGKMHVTTSYNGQYVVINTSSDAYVEKMGVADPDTCPSHGPAVSYRVESNGDIFLVRFYLHSFEALGVSNIDIHRMDTSEYIWRRVERIGGATFFLGSNCVALSSPAAGTQADFI